MNIREITVGKKLKRYFDFQGHRIEYSCTSFHTAFRQITPIRNAPLWLVMGAYYEITTHHCLN